MRKLLRGASRKTRMFEKNFVTFQNAVSIIIFCFIFWDTLNKYLMYVCMYILFAKVYLTNITQEYI